LEFQNLNLCLDIVIAGAVTEFESARHQASKGREVETIGTMAHELRNALNRAVISYEMISKGIVGVGGSTGRVLQYSLSEMNLLIERALSEVRLRADSEVFAERFFLADVISQLVITAEVEASRKNLTLMLLFDPFTQQNKNRSGLGLGLTISRKATEKCEGTLKAFNIEGGCVFQIALPRAELAAAEKTTVV